MCRFLRSDCPRNSGLSTTSAAGGVRKAFVLRRCENQRGSVAPVRHLRMDGAFDELLLSVPGLVCSLRDFASGYVEKVRADQRRLHRAGPAPTWPGAGRGAARGAVNRCRCRRFHRAEAHLILSAMRHRAAELGDRVRYVKADTCRPSALSRTCRCGSPSPDPGSRKPSSPAWRPRGQQVGTPGSQLSATSMKMLET